jgi:hypothetical protein
VARKASHRDVGIHAREKLLRDDMGMIVQHCGDRQTFPHYVRGPVETGDDWERLKAERLRPTLEGRLPPN